MQINLFQTIIILLVIYGIKEINSKPAQKKFEITLVNENIKDNTIDTTSNTRMVNSVKSNGKKLLIKQFKRFSIKKLISTNKPRVIFKITNNKLPNMGSKTTEKSSEQSKVDNISKDNKNEVHKDFTADQQSDSEKLQKVIVEYKKLFAHFYKDAIQTAHSMYHHPSNLPKGASAGLLECFQDCQFMCEVCKETEKGGVCPIIFGCC